VKFFSEIFQDTDGGFSSKRVAFFIMIFFFVGLSLAVVFHGVTGDVAGFAQGAIDKAKDIIQWLGAYILADKAPAAIAAAKGKPTDPTKTGG
jgi:hypothetical protein